MQQLQQRPRRAINFSFFTLRRQQHRLLWLLLLAVSVVAGPKYVSSPPSDLRSNLNANATIIVEPFKRFGTWQGWGVSLCWWANIFGQRDDIADLAFSNKTVCINETNTCLPGLGLNIARYNAGGSSWAKVGGVSMQVSPNIRHWKQIEGFWNDWNSDDIHSSSWNWSADANQIAMLRKAHSRGANYLELFSNSPMWWMLYNHNPSGSDSGSADNLQKWDYRNHSKYLATIAEYARKTWGLEFTSVEPLNEPIATWWRSTGNQEGCHFDHSTQAVCVQHLHAQLARHHLTAVVSASDENTYDQARATWASFDQTTKDSVGKFNVHGYQGSGGRRDLLYKDVHAAGKRLWNSEYGDEDGSGRSMASNLHLDLKLLHNTAWVYWQFLDEADGWGLLKFNSKSMKVESVSKKYAVLAQFTRHIREGMEIIDSGDVNTVAAHDASKKRLVLVTTNYGTARSITYDLSWFITSAVSIHRWSTVLTNSFDHGDSYIELQDVELMDKTFTVDFPADTMQTLEVEGIEVALQILI